MVHLCSVVYSLSRVSIISGQDHNCSYKTLLVNRLYILNFDLLCKNPVEKIENLNQFLSLEVTHDQLESVASSVIAPASPGRHKRHDCLQLCPRDVDFVRSLGFDILGG